MSLQLLISRFLLYTITTTMMLFTQPSSADIYYHIKHIDNRVYIKADFGKYSANKQIKLYIPSNIWGIYYDKQIKNIKVYDGNFNVQNSIAILNTDGPLKIEYELINITKDEFLAEFANRYYHFFDKQRFYMLGLGSFIYPDEKNDDKENVVIDISSTAKKIAYNFPSYFYKSPINVPFKKLQEIIIFGNEDFYFKNDKDITILVWTTDNALGKYLNNIASNVFIKHKEFWGNTEKMILVVSIPNPFISKRNKFGATVISNSIIAFINPNANEEEDLYSLFSHEILHFWFGSNMLNGPKWFTEGFTDYYVDKINYYYSGNFQKFISNYNKKLYLYFSSPFSNLTDKDIEQHFFNLQVVEKLPYLKGYLIAGQVDSITDLDAILKLMFKNCKENKQKCVFSPRLLAEYIQNISIVQQKHIYSLISNFNKAKLVYSFLGKAILSSKIIPSVKYINLNITSIIKNRYITGKYLNSLDSSFDVNKSYTLLNIEQDYENNLRFFIEDVGKSQEFFPATVPIITKIPQYSLKKQS